MLTQARFRGSLLGVLVGDCCGAPFEGRNVIANAVMEHLEQFEKSPGEQLKCTDDTFMTMSTCRSLIANKGLNPAHLAKEYTESFFQQPNRGYGAAVKQVFYKLKETNYQDPFGPAADQFDGMGSFGNGAAMRCNGIALYAHKHRLNDRQTVDLVENCSRITHSHVYGINGAILLTLAIRYVLALEEDTLDECNMIDHLIQRMNDLESEEDKVFVTKLRIIRTILTDLSISGNDVTQQDVVKLLGNNVSAQESVPLAIYSFLRGNSKFTDAYRLDNEFIRTLHWAISCGGDTDTIASMACGLSGAYLGINKIPENLFKNCESWQEMMSLADKLYSQS